MNKSKKIKNNEARWTLLPNNINPNDQANKTLEKRVPSDILRHFAKLNVGRGFFEWTFTSENEVLALSQAPAEDRDIVMNMYSDVAERVKECFGNSIVGQRIVCVPNEDYICYSKDETGKIQLHITGWGFANVKGPSLKPLERRIPPAPSSILVNIGFMRGGELVPNKSFLLKIPTQIRANELSTGNDGLYHFEKPLKEGTQFVVTDNNTQREYQLTVIKNQTDYIFDVTQHTHVNISVTYDNIPSAGMVVRLTYQGKTEMLETDANGNASTALIYGENENITVEVDEASETQQISADGNTFIFALRTKVYTSHVKVVDQNGNIVSGYHLIVSTPMQQTDMQTDDSGCVVLPEMRMGEQFHVADDNGSSQVYSVSNDDNEFIFPIYVVPPMPIVPRLTVVDQEGNIVPNYDLMYSSNQGEMMMKTDETGVIILPEMSVEDTFSVTDHTGLSQSYHVTPENYDFIFQVNLPLEERVVRIRVLDRDGSPLDYIPVYVDTPLGTFSSTSDHDGYAIFPASAFVDKKKAKIRFTITKEYKKRKKQQGFH